MFFGLLTISMATLLFELSLTKLFSVIIFSNYAFMIISTALFGFGLSGVFSSLFSGIMKRFATRGGLIGYCLAFGITSLGAFFVINHVPLQLAEIHKPLQMLYLAINYLSLIIPFFFSGMAIVTVFFLYTRRISTLYFFDLVGAALGCLMIIPVYRMWGGAQVFFIIFMLSGLSAFFFNEFQNRKRTVIISLFLVLSAFFLPAFRYIPIRVHDFKRTYKEDQVCGNIEYSRWSALSKIDIALAPEAGWKRLWIDGGTNESALIEFDGKYGGFRPNQLNHLTIAIPHLFKKKADVAIIGSSGGREVLVALNNNPSSVDAIEMDPTICEIVSKTYGEYIGNIFKDPRLQLNCDEGRSFIKRSKKQYDIIQQVNNFTPIAMASGAINVSESYLLTLDAFDDYWQHLKPDGILALNRHNTFKIAMMTQEFLEKKGLDASKHMIIVEGEDHLNNGFYLKKSPFTDAEIQTFETLAKERNVSILYSALTTDEKNWYVRLLKKGEKSYFCGLKGLNLDSPTDNCPFFEHIEGLGKIDLSDASTPEDIRWIHNVKKLGNTISAADLTFAVLLAEATLFSLLFIFVPLFSQKREGSPSPFRFRFLGFFFSIGLGFILIEICLIQKFVLFLGVPIYSISAVIFSLLLWSAVGSFLTNLFTEIMRLPRVVWICSLVLLSEIIAMVFGLNSILNFCLTQALWMRFLITFILISPLGIVMGMFFPIGIKLVDEKARALIPWMWGINAYATVIGSVLSVLLAIKGGFSFVFMLAALIYVFGATGMLKIMKGPAPHA